MNDTKVNPKAAESPRLTVTQKLDLMQQLYWTALKLKATGIRMRHPEWTEDEVRQAAKEAIWYARD